MKKDKAKLRLRLSGVKITGEVSAEKIFVQVEYGKHRFHTQTKFNREGGTSLDDVLEDLLVKAFSPFTQLSEPIKYSMRCSARGLIMAAYEELFEPV